VAEIGDYDLAVVKISFNTPMEFRVQPSQSVRSRSLRSVRIVTSESGQVRMSQFALDCRIYSDIFA
jgi:hypothetical protein